MATLDAARSQQLTPSEPGTSLPLVPGLLSFALVSLLGNELASWLRYPELGSAVLFVPYAVLTAVLVYSPRKQWVWYLLLAVATHIAGHWGGWPLSWILMADAANLARALAATVLLRRFFHGSPASGQPGGPAPVRPCRRPGRAGGGRHHRRRERSAPRGVGELLAALATVVHVQRAHRTRHAADVPRRDRGRAEVEIILASTAAGWPRRCGSDAPSASPASSPF